MSDGPVEVQVTASQSAANYYQQLHINLSDENLLEAAERDNLYTAPPESLKYLLSQEQPGEQRNVPHQEQPSVCSTNCKSNPEVTERDNISERYYEHDIVNGCHGVHSFAALM